MKIIEPKVELMDDVDGRAILKKIELAGRTCYKSEAAVTDESAEKFVARVIASGHESVIEHASVTVRFTTDRGISHEIVRHRIASYSQESTRYCNYSKDKFGNEITVVRPSEIEEGTEAYELWKDAVKDAEAGYFELLAVGCKAQTARAVLPTCVKTELVMTMNLRELRHFISLRKSEAAHPDVRRLAVGLLDLLKEKIPVVFDDL